MDRELDDVAVAALEDREWRTALDVRAESWTPLALDSDPPYGAVLVVRSSGRGSRFVGMWVLCHESEGGWQVLEANGDRWDSELGSRAEGAEFEIVTSTTGVRHGAYWLQVLAGAVEAGVTGVTLEVESRTRHLSIEPRSGAFVALAVSEGERPAPFQLRAYARGRITDEVMHRPAETL